MLPTLDHRVRHAAMEGVPPEGLSEESVMAARRLRSAPQPVSSVKPTSYQTSGPDQAIASQRRHMLWAGIVALFGVFIWIMRVSWSAVVCPLGALGQGAMGMFGWNRSAIVNPYDPNPMRGWEKR